MRKIRMHARYFYLKNRSQLQRYIWILLVTCLVSCIGCTVIFYLISDYVLDLMLRGDIPSTYSVKKARGLSVYDKNIRYNDFNYLISDTLTYDNRTYENNTEILFRLPKQTRISALLLIFHGCSGSAHNWFHTIERQRIIGAAIDLGYGCIAFQATDKFSKCWSNNIDIENNDDLQMVYKGLQGFYKEYPQLEKLPRFTFGASSGGVFSSVFAINQRYKIQGQIIFISIVLPEILQTYVKTNSYPSTAWIYMIRDTEFASEERINKSIQVFIEQKIAHISLAIYPIALSISTFHDRIPKIRMETSRYILYRFQQNQWLDSLNYLVHNPRRVDTWKTFLFTAKSETKEMKRILTNINEHKHIFDVFLNTIYGEHEISFENSYEALKWHKDIYNKQTNSTI